MSLEKEFIPGLEIPLGEKATPSWDLAALKIQLGVTISSVAWSVEDATVLTLGANGSTGDVFFTAITGIAVGCSHLILDVTTSDPNQNPTKLFMKITVIDPKCPSL